MKDELERQIRRQFLQPWNKADEEGKKGIYSAWKNGDKQAYWTIREVLEKRYQRLAIEACGDDEVQGIQVFDRTFDEFEQNHRTGKLTYLSQGQFFRSFTELLRWRCKDVLKSGRMTPLQNIISLYQTLFEGEEDETLLVDIIPGDIATPEQIADQSEIEEQFLAKFWEKWQSLSPILQDTLKAMYEVAQEAQENLGKHYLIRKIREKLGISETTLNNRVHRIRQALAPVYQEWRKLLED